MKATIGIMGAALLCLGLTAAVANDAATEQESRIAVSDLGDRTLLLAAREANEPVAIETVADERAQPARTVRMVGPSFFPDE